MIEKPVEDHVVNARWCKEIQAIVFDARHASSIKNLSSTSEGKSLAFEQALASSRENFIRAVLAESEEPIQSGNRSRNYSEGAEGLDWTAFLPEEQEFIDETMATNVS